MKKKPPALTHETAPPNSMLPPASGSKEHIQQVASLVSDGLLIVDGERMVRYANPPAMSVYGLHVGDHLSPVYVFDSQVSKRMVLTRSDLPGQTLLTEIVRMDSTWDNQPAQVLIFHKLSEADPALDSSEGQRLLSTLINNLPGLAYRCLNDSQWTMIFISEGCLVLTGYAPGELIHNRRLAYADLIYASDRQYVWDTVQQAIADGKPYQLVYRIQTAGQELRWVWEQGEAVYTPQGEVLALEGFITDITQRKQAEQALADSEQKYHSLVDTSPDAVLLIGLDKRIVTCSQWAAELIGSTNPEEMIGQYVLDFLVPQDRDKARSDFIRVAKKGTQRNLRYRITNAHGEILHIEVSASVIPGEDGRARAFTLVVREISERIAAEDALRRSEARYRAIVEDNAEMICRYLDNGTLTFVNEAYCLYFSAAYEDLIGRPFQPQIFAADRPAVEKMLHGLNPTMPPATLEYRLILPNGEIRWTRWTHRVVVDAAGQFIEYQAVGMDVTSLKAAEQAGRESERHLRDLLENIKLIAIILDAKGCLQFANTFLLGLTGWQAHEMTGKPWFDTFVPATASLNMKHVFQDAVQTGIIAGRYQHAILTRTGDQRVIGWNNTLLRDSSGRVTGMASIGEDITERKWVEQVQSAIYQISQAANSAKNLVELYHLIHDILGELMPVKNFFISIYDPLTDEISFPYFVDEFDLAPIRKHPGRGLTEYVLRTGQSLLASPDVFELLVAQDEVESLGAPSLDWLGVPLKIEDRTIGVMVTQTYTEGVRFNPRHEQIMRFVSNQVAMAIDRKRNELDLDINRERYRALVEASTDAIFLETLDGRILECNDTASRLYGYSKEEFLNLTVSDIVTPEEAAGLPDLIPIELAEGGFFVTSYGLRRDGSSFPTEVSGRVVMLGERRLLVVYVRDITERIATETALRQSEEKFRQLAQTTAAGIFIHRAEKFLYVNPAWEAITGYTRDELLALEFWRIAPPDDQERIHKKAQARLAGQPVENRYELLVLHKSGQERWLDISAGVIVYEGQPAIIITANDITERKLSEERLRLQSAALEAAANAIVITNPKGEIIFVNQAFTWLTEYTPEEAFGQNPRILRSDRQSPEFYKEMWRTISSGQVWHGELVNRRKDGSTYAEEMTITPVHGENDEIVNYIAIKQDITYRKTHEQELEVIAQLSSALRTATTRAEILPIIVLQLMDLLKAEGAVIATIDPITNETVLELGGGAWQHLTGRRLTPNEGVSGHVIRTGQLYVNNHAGSDPHFAFTELETHVPALASIPLVTQGRSLGAMLVGTNLPFEDEQLRILITISDIAVSAIHRADLYEQTLRQAIEVAQAYDATIEGWAHALELRDKETQGHTRRVTTMTIQLARALGVPESQLIHIRRGALLHDIGKVGVPDAILFKTGPLSDEEWTIMRRHPQYAYEMLSSIEYLVPALEIPFCHHERWNGQGYPRGLHSTEIPLAARIFAIIDAWDALTSDRPYRHAWQVEEARKYLLSKAGDEFDPDITKVFLALEEQGKITPIWK